MIVKRPHANGAHGTRRDARLRRVDIEAKQIRALAIPQPRGMPLRDRAPPDHYWLERAGGGTFYAFALTGRSFAGSRVLLPQATGPGEGHCRLVAAGIERDEPRAARVGEAETAFSGAKRAGGSIRDPVVHVITPVLTTSMVQTRAIAPVCLPANRATGCSAWA